MIPQVKADQELPLVSNPPVIYYREKIMAAKTLAMIKASVSVRVMQDSVCAPPVAVALAELVGLVEESLDVVLMITGGRNWVVTVGEGPAELVVLEGDISSDLAAVTLTAVEMASVESVVSSAGTGAPTIDGGSVCHPESTIVVGLTAILAAVVIGVPTIMPLGIL